MLGDAVLDSLVKTGALLKHKAHKLACLLQARPQRKRKCVGKEGGTLHWVAVWDAESWNVLPTVQPLQRRSDVAVGGLDAYSPLPHVCTAKHEVAPMVLWNGARVCAKRRMRGMRAQPQCSCRAIRRVQSKRPPGHAAICGCGGQTKKPFKPWWVAIMLGVRCDTHGNNSASASQPALHCRKTPVKHRAVPSAHPPGIRCCRCRRCRRGRCSWWVS